MARLWLRRALLWAASASALVLAACGSGTIESQLSPSRLVVFGDAFADVGQTGSRYTINDGSVNVWTQQVASRFGLTLTPAAAGGTGYATGNARVVLEPDAAGNPDTPTVKEQVDAFLAADSFTSSDLVIINAGVADIVAEMMEYTHGGQTRTQLLADVALAGRELGTQVRRLVQAGARQVVVMGPYDLSRSVWGQQHPERSLVSEASGDFNEELLVSIADLGASVLYVDVALYLNLVTATPDSYQLVNVTTITCTSVDPGPGIGLGPGEVNSALCTPSTLATGVEPLRYGFADKLYPTPQLHRLIGDFAYDRIRSRW